MRVLRSFLVLVLLSVVAVGGLAQPVTTCPNTMGIYFDTEATVYCSDAAAGGPLTFYLMITNPTGDQIAAWECKVEWDQMGGGFFGNWTFANDGINVGDTSDPLNTLLAVGVGANPIQPQPATILATWSGFFGYGTGSVFKITPYPDTASFDPPAPGYAIDEVNLQACGVSSGDFDLPVAAIGLDCPVVIHSCTTPVDISALQSYDESGAPVYGQADVLVQGTVTTAPGTVVADGFYVQDGTGGILVTRETMPSLAVGDRVEAAGILADRDGEILIAGRTITPQGTTAPVLPDTVALVSLVDAYDRVATLTWTTGIVAAVDQDSLLLRAGSAELPVLFGPGTGIDPAGIEPGDVLEVTGILTVRNRRIVLLPRSRDDLFDATPDFGFNVLVEGTAVGGTTWEDFDNVAGVTPTASNGFDSGWDVIGTGTPIVFTGIDGYELDHDLRREYDPVYGSRQWPLRVTTPRAAADTTTVTLVFTPRLQGLTGFPVLLLDPAAGDTLDLLADGTVTYPVPPGAGDDVRDFVLVIGNTPGPFSGPLSVVLTATCGDLVDGGNRAETLEGATDGYDPALDVPEAPVPPSGYLSLAFPHPEWGSPLGDDFQVDRRAVYNPLQEQRVWTFAVRTDRAEPVTVTFEPSFVPADGFRLRLMDHTDGVVRDLYPDLSYTFTPTPGATRQFDLIVGNPPVPLLSPVERVLPAGWSLIGFPLTPAAGQNTLGQAVQDDAASVTFFYSYHGAAGYTLEAAETAFQPGDGFWCASVDSFAWTMEGEKEIDGVRVPLQQGWNIVGYPLWIPTDLAGVRVDLGPVRYTFQQAVDLGLVAPTVYDYDNAAGDYVTGTQLQTWHGYFVAAYSEDVSLWFDYTNIPTSKVLRPDPFEAMDADHWLVTVVPDGGTPIRFGVSSEARDGFDPVYDLPLPPPSPVAAAAPRLALVHPEWRLATGSEFVADVQSADSKEHHWDAVLTVSRPGPVTLDWSRSAWPEGEDFQIYLPQQNRVVVMSMRDQKSVTLDVGTEPLLVRFRTPDMTTGADDVPQARAALSCRPNPFNPRTEIRMVVPRAGEAVVRVFDVQGRVVRTLRAGRVAAGEHAVTWQGRTDSGGEAASGVYFARLYLDGRPTGAIGKMSLVR